MSSCSTQTPNQREMSCETMVDEWFKSDIVQEDLVTLKKEVPSFKSLSDKQVYVLYSKYSLEAQAAGWIAVHLWTQTGFEWIEEWVKQNG